jgi:hypothetical protein
MKLNRFISALIKVSHDVGDVEVFFSSDEEGNSFHSTPDLVGYCRGNLRPIRGGDSVKGVVLFPNHDDWDLTTK